MRTLLLWAAVTLGAAAGFTACAAGGDSNEETPDSGSDLDAGDDSGFTLGDGSTTDDFASIAIEPKSATLEVDDGVPATSTFKVIGTKSDGSTAPLSDAIAWSATNPAVGAIAGGVFTANGALGGMVQIKATRKGKTAAADLIVRLKMKSDALTVDDIGKDKLRKADAPDAAIKWAYPYTDTVFPRGLAGPTLMWFGGAASDDYRVHLASGTFEYEAFIKVSAPPRYDLPEKVWTKFVESTSGGATLTVSRLAGTTATRVTQLKWTVAPGSMRGTIYYWSNREGRVLRIKPGAAAPDDFSATVLPKSAMLSDGTTTSEATCTMTCHRVSADGSTLISGGDVFGGSYDLATNKPRYSFTATTYSARRTWHFGSPTPNGKYVVTHGNGEGGLFSTADGGLIPATGLEKVPTWYPAFSPTGKQLFYVDFTGPGANALWSIDFDETTLKFGAKKMLVDPAAVATQKSLSYPSGAPDGKWIIYQRATVNADTRGTCVAGEPTCKYDNRGDLYLAQASDKAAEIALAKLNGTGYPFAAGSRDLSWNFEPTFAPVAAGGYFWVVFTTRRSYGNAYEGPLNDPAQVKQLWVAAIDMTVTPGKDPSHAAFRLPGQALTFKDGAGASQNSLNMSGYWALEPCKTDGVTCTAGSDCCGGFCEKKEGEATGTCKSVPPPCSAEGDKCSKDDDCCGKGEGARCVGGFCSQKPPA
jgi:hypothetical protein